MIRQRANILGRKDRYWAIPAALCTALAAGFFVWSLTTVTGLLARESIGLAWHLARGGALQLSAADVPIDGKPAAVEIVTGSDGSTFLEIQHPNATAVLALGPNRESGKLLLPRSGLALKIAGELPDFELGDPKNDELSLPEFDLPRLSTASVLMLPFLARNYTIRRGNSGGLEWEQGAISAKAHWERGALDRIEIAGVLPGSLPLVVHFERVSGSQLRNKLQSLDESPPGIRVEEVSRGIFLRSIDGLLTALQP